MGGFPAHPFPDDRGQTRAGNEGDNEILLDAKEDNGHDHNVH